MPDGPDVTYNGEQIRSPLPQRTVGEKLDLLDWHPLFTGRCPQCEMTLLETEPPRVHWGCEHCGWTLVY